MQQDSLLRPREETILMQQRKKREKVNVTDEKEQFDSDAVAEKKWKTFC